MCIWIHTIELIPGLVSQARTFWHICTVLAFFSKNILIIFFAKTSISKKFQPIFLSKIFFYIITSVPGMDNQFLQQFWMNLLINLKKIGSFSLLII
jgi:hypothetical protein